MLYDSCFKVSEVIILETILTEPQARGPQRKLIMECSPAQGSGVRDPEKLLTQDGYAIRHDLCTQDFGPVLTSKLAVAK